MTAFFHPKYGRLWQKQLWEISGCSSEETVLSAPTATTWYVDTNGDGDLEVSQSVLFGHKQTFYLLTFPPQESDNVMAIIEQAFWNNRIFCKFFINPFFIQYLHVIWINKTFVWVTNSSNWPYRFWQRPTPVKEPASSITVPKADHSGILSNLN